MDSSDESIGSNISDLMDSAGSDLQKSTSSSKSRESQKEPTKKSIRESPPTPAQEKPSKPSQEPSNRPTQETSMYDIFGPESKYKQWRHETMNSVFEKHKPEYDKLLSLNDISTLKMFILKNYNKIVWCEFLQNKLEELINTFASTDQKETVLKDDRNADTMIMVIRELLEECQRKVAAVDVSFDTSGTLEGSVLNALVEKSRKKMSEVMEELQYQIREQQAEIAILREVNMEMKNLEKELEATKLYIRHLHERNKFDVQDPPSHDEFIADLRFKLQTQTQMSSSLLDELENEKRTKEKLLDQYLKLESLRIYEHQERLKEIAEATKDLELDKGIKLGIIEKIKSLTAKPEEIEKAVNDWLKATHEVIKPKQKEIHELKASIKSVDDQIVDLREKLEDTKLKANEKYIALRRAEAKLEEMTEEMKKHYESLREQAEYEALEYNEYVSSLMRYPRDLDAIPEEPPRQRSQPGVKRPLTEKQYRKLTPSMTARLQPHQIPASIRFQPTPSIRNLRTRPQKAFSPESFREESPEYTQGQFEENSPINMQPTPPREVPEISVTPPSPTINGRNVPSFNEAIETEIPTQSYPQNTSPEASPINSFPEFTPEGFRTPFIPKSRFGYTDPTVKVLNLPPGPFQMVTPLRQTVVLTSPLRKEPLLVNIGVDPKPLSQTENGEHFICDISLDVQPGHQDLQNQQELQEIVSPQAQNQQEQQRKISPTVTFGIPPAVTPTSTRKYGLFTPKGIFQKRHFNIRRVPGKNYIRELPWSPQNLPQEVRSPLGPFPPSPCFSDGSISWEKSPESYYDDSPESIRPNSDPYVMNRTFDRSPSPVIQGPSFRYRTDYGSTPESSPSPLIKGPSYRFRSPGLDNTFESSPSPLIKGPSYRRQSPGLDNTVESSPSPLIKGSSFNQSSNLDGTQYSSPSPLIKGPSYRRRSPGLDNTFESSPPLIEGSSFNQSSNLDGTQYSSPSPLIKGPSYRRRSPGLDNTFESSPPLIEGSSFNQSPDLDGYTQDSSPSPLIKGPSYRSRSPGLKRTYESSPSPLIQGSSYSYQSPGSDNAFEESTSPMIKRPSYVRSPSTGSSSQRSSPLESAFQEHQTPTSFSSSDRSESPLIRGLSYGNRSSSPESSFQRSPSPVIERSFYEPQTHSSFGTSDGTASPAIQGLGYQSSGLNSSYDIDMSPLTRIKKELHRPYGPDNTFGSSHSSSSPGSFDVSPQPMTGSPLYGTPPSGYQADLDSSGSPEISRIYDRSSHGINQSFNLDPFSSNIRQVEDPLNRQIRLDDWPQPDLISPERRYREYPLNKRVRFNEMSPDRTTDSSFSPQRNQNFDSSAEFSSSGHLADPLNRRMQFEADEPSGYRYQDPLEARMTLGNMTENHGEDHFSHGYLPDMNQRMSSGYSLNKTYDSESSDFDHAYLDRSLNDKSLLNESMYHRSP